MKSLYIHIPFCKSICSYCDFAKMFYNESLALSYLEELSNEVNNNYKQDKLETIYIGGGTPSFIPSKYITEVLKSINKDEAEEITIEVNPGTVTEEKLKDYLNAGINRLSIGLQSTNNKILQEISRIHTFEQFLETYKLAKEVGFGNINIDLMIGLPSQRLEDVQKSLEEVIKLKPKHVSVYSLILEPGTVLERKVTIGV